MTALVKDLKLPRPIGDEFTGATFRAGQVFCIFKPRGAPCVFPYDIVVMCLHGSSRDYPGFGGHALEAAFGLACDSSADGAHQGNN